MANEIILGKVRIPSGNLVILDPGLGKCWRHSDQPQNHDEDDNIDMAITGPDAEVARHEFTETSDASDLFDNHIHAAHHLRQEFAEFASSRGFDARMEMLPHQVSHLDRARMALAEGSGAGLVPFDEHVAVVVGGLPTDRILSVVGIMLPDDDESGGGWKYVDLVVDPAAEVASSEILDGVAVENPQLAIVDLDTLGRFRGSHDGLTDLAFNGIDAAQLAKEVGARPLNDEWFGWTDLPAAETERYENRVRAMIADRSLRIYDIHRPCDDLERLLVRSRISAGQGPGAVLTTQDRAIACVLWLGPWVGGPYPVTRHLDADGRLVRVRIDVDPDEEDLDEEDLRAIARLS